MTTATAARAVVVDLGNVVVRWEPQLPFVGRVAPADVAAFFADVDFPAFNHRQDAGRSWADARAEVARLLPQHLATLDVYVQHFADSLPGPVPGTAQVLHELRAQGVRLIGLTNWSAETFHHAEPAAPAIGLLEGVLVSGRVGVAKPDPEVFALLVAQFGLDPATTVFTDDSPVNVAASVAAGFDGLLFTSATRLRADLVARGLLPDGRRSGVATGDA